MLRVWTFAITVLTTAPLLAGDWPQWLGPKRDGVSKESVEPWTEAPKVLWRQPVGPGYSVPIVADGRVFVHEQVRGKEEEQLTAYDAKTGKQLWRDVMPRSPYKSILNTGPQGTPAVAAGKVYSFGINGLLSCHSADDGKRLWQVDVYKQFPVELPRYGVCCSPLVIGNRVLVSVGGKGSSVVAFDSADGEVAWQGFDDPASTSSPILFSRRESLGLPDVVFMTGLRLVAVNPLDGTLNWEYPSVFQPSGASPTPLVAGDRIITSTMTNGSTAVRISAEEERIHVAQEWQVKDLSGYFSSGVIDINPGEGSKTGQGRLFLITNSLLPIPTAALRCIDLKDGKELWQEAGIGYFHAGLIRCADGRLLLLDDSGNLKLVDARADKYKLLAKAKVCGGTLTCPSLADGKVYVLDDKEVVCLELKP